MRVAMTSDGGYEILDGFKRVDRWRRQGHELVPVVIEPAASSADHKRLLLCSNAPPRTLTAMDEARGLYLIALSTTFVMASRSTRRSAVAVMPSAASTVTR